MKKNFLLAILLALGLTTKILAMPIGILTDDKQGNYFRYDYNELIKSAINNAVEINSPLFDDYYKKDLIAFQDDKIGYVNAKFINEEATKASVFEREFDFLRCLSIDGKSHIVDIYDNVINVTEKDGQIVSDYKGKEFDVLKIY